MTINNLGIVETYDQNDLNHDYRHYVCRNRTTGEYLRYPLSVGGIYTTTDASEAFIVGGKLCEALRFLFRNNLTGWGIVAI